MIFFNEVQIEFFKFRLMPNAHNCPKSQRPVMLFLRADTRTIPLNASQLHDQSTAGVNSIYVRYRMF